MSYYSVVQYTPDALADERINIGVIAFDDEIVASRFLCDWERVRAFASRDITFLQDFADDVRLHPEVYTAATLTAMAAQWHNSIQVTRPRASLLDLNRLVPHLVDRFLHDVDRSRAR